MLLGLKRNPNSCDRPCDKCGKPMIGVMYFLYNKAPRKICEPCGGKSVFEVEKNATST
jgi:hypothetical protein